MNMKKLFSIAVMAAAATGCVSHPASPEVKAVVNGTVQPLRVLVSIDGSGDKSGNAYALSGYLQSNLEGALAAGGYRVVYEGDHEILVSTCGSVMCKERNRRGSRSVYYGDADVQVTRAAFRNTMTDQTMRDVVARQRFDVQGGEARTRTEAIKSVADSLGPALSQWAAQSVSKIAAKLERCEVTIDNAWTYRGEEDYPSRFVATVHRMRGVYQCRIISTDNVNRSFRAEIVYDKDMYPDGIVNGLIATRGLNLYR
jgi:hypothetical protein